MTPTFRRIRRWSVLLVLIGLLFSCTSVRYYSQSVSGHLSIWMQQRAITDLLDDNATDAKLKERLRLVLEIRRFATKELDLPENKSFTSYANLGRNHVVYNVVATPEFSVEPIKFCFLVVGCLNYKGYFKRDAAVAEGARLRKEGYDVIVGGVTAYSTLGWFADPVLNTFVNFSEEDLAGLIFHELTHQLIYIDGDSTFNESFATTVELEGVRRWMRLRGTPELARKYQKEKIREDEFRALMLKYRKLLENLYKQEIPEAEKRVLKAKLFTQLRTEFQEMSKSWGGDKSYEAWVKSDLNNAKIAAAVTYYDYIESFDNLLKSKNNDLKKFYEEVRMLGAMKPALRQERLIKLKAK